MKEEGFSIKEMARTFDISKNTVKKYIRNSEPLKFHKPKVPKKIDPYLEAVQEMVEKKYIGTRIYRELLSLGYSGGIAQIRRTIRKWKQEQKKSKRITTRVETNPGQQAQYDWKEWMLPVKEQPIKIYLHQVILSYSRNKRCACSREMGVYPNSSRINR